MKNTAFIQIHKALGAKIVPFAGYNMPVQFEGVITEHETVRKKVGVFDVSHMGEFWIKGPNAFELVQRLTTNDLSKIGPGQAQYTCFTNEKGGIVDDLIAYCYDREKYMLVVNAANIEKDWDWVTLNNTGGAILENASDNIAQLAIQGPKALETLQKLTDVDLKSIPFYHFKEITFAGFPNINMSATGYTGEKNSFEIYFDNKYADKIWAAIFEAGKEYGIKPIGLAARDTLRLEMGFCLYGNDINDYTSPIEAGLGWITKFVDGNTFNNRSYHEKIKNDGPSRRLRGFEMIDKGIPRQAYEICDAKGNKIGEVTSGTMSPSLKKAIGMGYIETAHAAFGHTIYIKVRDRLLKATIVKTPFYQGA